MEITDRVISTKKISKVMLEHTNGQASELVPIVLPLDQVVDGEEKLDEILSWGEFPIEEEK